MDKIVLEKYMIKFETDFIARGFEGGLVGSPKPMIISLRPGKFAGSDLEKFIGRKFICDKLLAINYYGFFKLSSEAYRAIESIKNVFPGIRSIKSPAIHFNSIKIEKISEIAPHLVGDFVEFKNHIVSLRWHKKKA